MASRTELRATPIDAASSGSGGDAVAGLELFIAHGVCQAVDDTLHHRLFFKFFTYPGVSFIIFSFYA